jgi:nucleoid-associated protein YgaU
MVRTADTKDGVMTKETKIGLLVGLAFIIVIGILLSDHIQSATEPPRAAIGDAGFTARRAVETPGAGANAEVALAAPNTPIPTGEELKKGPIAQSVIKVGPAQTATTAEDTQVVINKVTDPAPPLHADEPLVTGTPAPAGTIGDQGAQTPIVSNTQSNSGSALNTLFQPTPVSQQSPVNPVKVAMKSYVALKGDSLSKIAMKFYGDKSAASIKLITDANKELKDPRNLIAGKTYMIPANPKADAAQLAKTGPTTAPSAGSALAVATPTTPRNVSTVLYTVKDGDNLWRIATEEVGSAKAVQQIRDLNKDVLKGTDNVKAGAKLKIPAKVVASVN